VKICFDILAGGASSKPAAIRVVEAKMGIKVSTLRNWMRKAEQAEALEVAASEADKDAELNKLREENARLKEADEILKLTSAFLPRRSVTALK
jgi:transposase-like protein